MLLITSNPAERYSWSGVALPPSTPSEIELAPRAFRWARPAASRARP
jgi:hypothetical protein